MIPANRIRAASSRLVRVPTFALRSLTSSLASRRLERQWPELGRLFISERVTTGGAANRRDAIRRAVPAPDAAISILVPSKRPRMIDNIVDNVSRQNLAPAEVVLVVDSTTHTADDIAVLADRLGEIALTTVEAPPSQSLGFRLNAAVEAAGNEWLARMDDDDWYGEAYLADSIRAATVSHASMVGKATYSVVWTAEQRARLRFPGQDYRFVSTVAGGTMLWNRTRAEIRFPDRSVGEDGGAQQRLLYRGGTIFSSDRFQYVLQRQSDATWSDHEQRLESSGPEITVVQAYCDDESG